MAYLKTATLGFGALLVASAMLGFGALLVASATLFMSLINQEHRHTFFSVETGARMTQRNFLEGDDVMKSEMIWIHMFTGSRSRIRSRNGYDWVGNGGRKRSRIGLTIYGRQMCQKICGRTA
ncbi:hypothetical protein TrLO_g1840 [Triparma laevis f. longispina]|uniref:Uncharacterized protein n=1 Tax=Triparma laevis f. longispina TaxID=1714387 RepID=A0A9W7ABT3_9STRA|nr:hypothetical protein TrLO_g1840 [Triparma laevis f. longispina]